MLATAISLDLAIATLGNPAPEAQLSICACSSRHGSSPVACSISHTNPISEAAYEGAQREIEDMTEEQRKYLETAIKKNPFGCICQAFFKTEKLLQQHIYETEGCHGPVIESMPPGAGAFVLRDLESNAIISAMSARMPVSHSAIPNAPDLEALTYAALTHEILSTAQGRITCLSIDCKAVHDATIKPNGKQGTRHNRLKQTLGAAMDQCNHNMDECDHRPTSKHQGAEHNLDRGDPDRFDPENLLNRACDAAAKQRAHHPTTPAEELALDARLQEKSVHHPLGRPALSFKGVPIMGDIRAHIKGAISAKAAQAIMENKSREGLLPRLCLDNVIDAEATVHAAALMTMTAKSLIAAASFGFQKGTPYEAARNQAECYSTSFPWPKARIKGSGWIQKPDLTCVFCHENDTMTADHIIHYCKGDLPSTLREAQKRVREISQLSAGATPAASETTQHMTDPLLETPTINNIDPLEVSSDLFNLGNKDQITKERAAAWASWYTGTRSTQKAKQQFALCISQWLRPIARVINGTDVLTLPFLIIEALAQVLPVTHLENCSPFTAPELPFHNITTIAFNRQLQRESSFDRGIKPPEELDKSTLICARFCDITRLKAHIRHIKELHKSGHQAFLVLAYEWDKRNEALKSMETALRQANAKIILDLPPGHTPTGGAMGFYPPHHKDNETKEKLRQAYHWKLSDEGGLVPPKYSHKRLLLRDATLNHHETVRVYSFPSSIITKSTTQFWREEDMRTLNTALLRSLQDYSPVPNRFVPVQWSKVRQEMGIGQLGPSFDLKLPETPTGK